MTRRHRAAMSLALATAELGAGTSCTPPPAPAPATIAHASDKSDALTVAGWVVDTIPPTTATTEEPTTTTTEPAPAVTTAVTAPVTAPATTRTTVPRPVAAPAGRCGGDLPPCWVMQRESGGNPRAVNRSSGASGKWQFMPGTWANYAGYANAADAPESVQDDKARLVWAGGAGCAHWAACA